MPRYARRAKVEMIRRAHPSSLAFSAGELPRDGLHRKMRRRLGVSPGPVVTLNRAVALAMVDGPRAGLALLSTLDSDERMAHTHRLLAVRAHLLELAGDTVAARELYQRAARMTASLPEQRYLALRAARLA